MRHQAPTLIRDVFRRARALGLVAGSAAVLASGCGGETGLDPYQQALSDPTDDPPTLAVVGGEETPVCGVPMTAKIPGCTATLISPTVLLTAKHCGPKAGMNIQFGEKPPFAFTIKPIKCVTAPNNDSAYCILPADERLAKIPTVPVLHGCEYTKFMKPGAKLLGVGFGQTMNTGPARAKLMVEVPVVNVRGNFIDVGDKTHDLCFGDSGGGAYIHLKEGDKDWGWRMVGTVTGTARIPGGGACGGTDYTTVLRHVKLIEDTEKIDITPCTNAAGDWEPGPDCVGFLTDIQSGGGAWPACTAGARTTAAIDSCGAGPGPSTPPPPPGGEGPGPGTPPPVGQPGTPTPPTGGTPPGPEGGTPPPVTPPPVTPPPPAVGGPAPSGTPPAGPTPPPAAGPDSQHVDGGFGCTVAGGTSSSGLSLLGLLIGIVALARRRRR